MFRSDGQDEFDEIDMFAYGVGANTSFAPYWAGMKKFLSGKVCHTVHNIQHIYARYCAAVLCILCWAGLGFAWLSSSVPSVPSELVAN